MSTQYLSIPPAEARHGDEVFHAMREEWIPAEKYLPWVSGKQEWPFRRALPPSEPTMKQAEPLREVRDLAKSHTQDICNCGACNVFFRIYNQIDKALPPVPAETEMEETFNAWWHSKEPDKTEGMKDVSKAIGRAIWQAALASRNTKA